MIKTITAENFRPYGRIIEYPDKHLKGNKRNLWRIVMKDEFAHGWRIAYLVVRDKSIRRLERHPYSYESFEPVRGRGLLYVAKAQKADSIQCFRLDKPVVLDKNIWHGVITLSDEWELKLTENAKVKCLYWPLPVKLAQNDEAI